MQQISIERHILCQRNASVQVNEFTATISTYAHDAIKNENA